jgi:hypothetical protein
MALAQSRICLLATCAAVATAGLTVAGCAGGAGEPPGGSTATTPTATTSSAASTAETLERDPTDRDDDRPGSRYDPDNDLRLTLGRAAEGAEAGEIAALIRRYYTFAASKQAGAACSLLDPLLLESLTERAAAGHSRSPMSMCVYLAGKLFRQRHREIVEDLAAIELVQVRVRERRGLVLARLAWVRERLIPVRRDGGVWKMNTLLDDGSP